MSKLKIWNLEQLQTVQNKLDQYIHEQHQISYQQTYHQRILALIVELNELANASRCFKYWSLKLRQDRAIVLEEYVDCLHFCLSLTWYYQLSCRELAVAVVAPADNKTLTQILLELNYQCHQLNNREQFYNWFLSFLSLSYAFGFSQEEIIAVYYQKNQVNFQRQEQNY